MFFFSSKLALSPAPVFSGLFTSPHLVDIRERIRIDGELISEDKYLRYFWEVWDKLEATKVGARPFSSTRSCCSEYLAFRLLTKARLGIEVGYRRGEY